MYVCLKHLVPLIENPVISLCKRLIYVYCELQIDLFTMFNILIRSVYLLLSRKVVCQSLQPDHTGGLFFKLLLLPLRDTKWVLMSFAFVLMGHQVFTFLKFITI